MQEFQLQPVDAVPAFLGGKKHLLNRIRQIVLERSTETPVGKFLATMCLSFLIFLFSVVFTASAYGFKKEDVIRQYPPVLILHFTSVQKDTTGEPVLNANVKSKIFDREKNCEKEVRILFRNDTVIEITVNGEKIDPDQMHEYDSLVEGIRENYRESVENLEEIDEKMDENQSKLEDINKDQCSTDLYAILKDIQMSFDEALHSLQNYNWNKGIREALGQARQESRIAMDRLSREDIARLQIAIRQAQEEVRRSLSEFRKQRPGGYHFEFYIPPFFSQPCHPDSMNPEEKTSEDSSSLESKLEKLEKNK